MAVLLSPVVLLWSAKPRGRVLNAGGVEPKSAESPMAVLYAAAVVGVEHVVTKA